METLRKEAGGVNILAARKLLENDEAHLRPLALVHLVLLGSEAANWEAKSVLEELSDITGAKIPPRVQNKIHALRCVLFTTHPWSRYDIFCHVCQAAAGKAPFWTAGVVPPTISELVRAVSFMRKTHPTVAFSDEVKKTMAAAMMHEGLVSTHQLLPVEREYLTRLGAPKAEGGLDEEALSQQTSMLQAIDVLLAHDDKEAQESLRELKGST